MSNAKTSIEQRAAAIARRIRSVSLGNDVGAVERAFAEAIVELVNDATNGMPKPVLPLGAEEHLLPWEGEVWGIFYLEGDSDPVALFFSEEDARRELEWRQKLPDDDDDQLPTMDIGVLRGESAIRFWNSYDPDPRTATEKPKLQVVRAPTEAGQ